MNPEYPVRNVSEIHISDMDRDKRPLTEIQGMMVVDYMENYSLSLSKGIRMQQNYTKLSTFKKHIIMNEKIEENEESKRSENQTNKKIGVVTSVSFNKSVHLDFEEEKLV